MSESLETSTPGRAVPDFGAMDGPFFDQPTETMGREDLRDLQLRKLASLLEVIWKRNRFYTTKLETAGFAPGDLRTLDDLARLPFTTKAELLEAQADGGLLSANCTFPEEVYTRIHQTSGTTGEPLRVYDTAESWAWWARCWAHVLTGAGLNQRDRLFLPFSFGPFIGFWAAVGGAELIGALVISGGGSDSRQRLDLIERFAPSAMCCTPTYALRLAEVAREQGIDPTKLSLRVTIHAGEPGASIPATKARIEQEWGVRCYDHAGASEVGAHSFECASQPGSIHVVESEFIAEVLEPETGRPVRPGERGELVLTGLGRPGFPVLRYQTGDVVQVDPTPCPCGRTFVRLSGGIVGRVDDMFVVRGVNVFPSAVDEIVRRVRGIDEYRVTVTRRHQMSHLVIEIECADGDDPAETCLALAAAIQRELTFRPEVVPVDRGRLPRFELKARRFFVDA
jgi:phenylacetate-CoA ligase